jgi:LysR family transcriptional regulator, low CO2-responsive transcriptional regulator
VTLNQLKVFLLVVRLGSFRAAANALGVSEPAVSQALTALRQSLGDQLLTRTSSGVELTAAGQRIIGLASQMVNLAVEAEAVVRQAQGGPALLRTIATATPGDAVMPALLQAFAQRATGIEATLGIASSEELGALLVERLADVAVGPKLSSMHFPGVVSEPLMRYRMILVANSLDPLVVSNARISVKQLRSRDWLVDASGRDPTSDVGRILTAAGIPDEKISVFPSQRAAWAAAATGEGVAPATEHLFARERHTSVSALNIDGFPLEQFWYINALPLDRRNDETSQFMRFASLPDAMQAMFREDGRIPASRFKPPVYVTIWN